MDNKEVRQEFWKLFKNYANEVGLRDLTYAHYNKLREERKHDFQGLIADKFNFMDEDFKDKIDKLNEKLSDKDQIKDKDSFFKFAEKANELDLKVLKDAEKKADVKPDKEKEIKTPEKVETGEKNISLRKRVSNYFANMSTVSKWANGIALGLLTSAAIFAGPATLLSTGAMVFWAVPVITIGGKALIKSIKSGKIREWLNNRKTKTVEEIDLPKDIETVKEEDLDKEKELPKEEDLYKDYELPTIEKSSDPEAVAAEAIDTADEIENALKRDGLVESDFVLPSVEKREDGELTSSEDAVSIEKEDTVQPEQVKEVTTHKPKHLAKPVDESKKDEIEKLQNNLKNLEWQLEQFKGDSKLNKTEAELEHEQHTQEVIKESIKETKKELRKLGVVQEKSLSDTLKTRARKLKLKSEKAIFEEKIDEANSYNYVISEIKEYLELEKKYKKASTILGSDAPELIELKKVLDEKGEKVDLMSSSVEDAYNFESRRSRK